MSLMMEKISMIFSGPIFLVNLLNVFLWRILYQSFPSTFLCILCKVTSQPGFALRNLTSPKTLFVLFKYMSKRAMNMERGSSLSLLFGSMILSMYPKSFFSKNSFEEKLSSPIDLGFLSP